ncbi:hypothetical protein GW796_09285 [archaeon]|nr:hypothetical protein [archaeon]NCT58921.1 hypothetical protein [archaeon]
MKIYQIYYDEKSKSKISRLLMPYNNSNPDKPFEFEYGVMRKLYKNFDFEKEKYLGVLSWKFKEKSRIDPSKLVLWLDKNKKKDVYTINPFYMLNKRYKSLWEQGEYFNPGIKNITKELLERANINLDLERSHSAKVACYCNYWVANKKFWDLYMSYTEKLYEEMYNSDEEMYKKLFIEKADKEINSGMFSFIMKRMFSSVLEKHQNEFKILPYFT